MHVRYASVVRAILLASLLLVPQFILSQQVRQWVARYSGPVKSGNDAANAIVTDDSGYVYVAGYVTSIGGDPDFITLKYSPDGALLWARTYDNGAEDIARAVAVDTGGNVYVAGSSGGGSGLDYAVVKYRRDGSPGWAAVSRYNGPGNGEDVPVAIAVADSQVVVVTGWSKGASSGLDYATVKFDSSGVQQWVSRYEGAGEDKPRALAVRLVGGGIRDIYVTGSTVDTLLDYLTIKVNGLNGVQHWAAKYNGPANGNDVARAIAVRTTAGVFVTGGSDGMGSFKDVFTIRYDTAGVVEWTARYNGTANQEDEGLALALQSSSRVYVAGRSVQPGAYSDFLTLYYNQSSGAEQWASTFNGAANDIDAAVAVTGGGSPYVCGRTAGIGTGYDYGLIQIGSGGSVDWSSTYDGPAHTNDIPTAMTTGGNGVYVTGSSIAKGTTSDLLTIKYVDRADVKYRTFTQESLVGKAVKIKLATDLPNAANVRDDAFLKAFPKIKKGYAGAPGGLLLGNVYLDSAAYGWIRINKGSNVGSFLPHTGISRGFDTYAGAPFIGEKKNPKLDKYNNHLLGELIAMKMNIAASDAEITPPTLGDLTYDDADTGNPYNGLTLRQIAVLADNYLTYWPIYPAISWPRLDSTLARVNRAFSGPLGLPVSSSPVVVTGVRTVDSVSYLQPTVAPMIDPLAFPKEMLETEPKVYALYQNYPNPFNPITTIEFDLPEDAMVSVRVYDILGREVAVLADDEEFASGTQELQFDASGFSSGVYYYRIVVNRGEFQRVKKMMLLK